MNKFKMSLILFIGVSFYCYEFYLRILTGAYQEQIVNYFNIQTHIGFSFLLSSYNVSYLLMQIPAGILLDKYGSKKILVIATLICGIGNIIFITGKFELAIIGRLLVGIGSSFAFIGVFKIILENFPNKYFAPLTSVVISLGILTAAFSQNISIIISNYDNSWISIFIYSGLFAIPLALIFQIFLPKNTQSIPLILSFSQIYIKSKRLLKSKILWKNAIWAGSIYIPIVVLTSQYGILYFKESYGFDPIYSGTMITILFMGWIIFSPIQIKLRKNTSEEKIISFSILLAIVIVLIFSTGLLKSYAMILIFLFGTFSASQVLVWHYFNKICPSNITTIGIAITNMIITLITEIGQLAVSTSIELGKILSIKSSYCISFSFVISLIIGLFVLRSLTKHKFTISLN